MNVVIQIMGGILVFLALIDVYLTVLHPRVDSSLLSVPIARGTWQLFRCVAQTVVPKKRNQLLSYGGPTIVVVIVTVWVLLLVFGFALISWTSLGSAIQTSQGQTPTDFVTAVYYSGYALTTLGTGDLTPQTSTHRLLIVLQAALGFSTFTLTITYILSVYSALTRRNTFALSLHHRTNNTADAAELLARLAADNNLNNIQQDISNMARDLINILETQNTYSILLYFRFRQTYYGLPRIMYLAMDMVTLIKSALDTEEYRSVVNSAAVTELWCGGLHLLEELSSALLPKTRKVREPNEQLWQEYYDRALERLKAEGIKIAPDSALYVSLRREWEPYLVKLTNYMAYKRQEVFQCER